MYDKYSYRIIWSENDQEYVGLCAELPSLSWLSYSQNEALDGILKLAANVINDMKKQGEKIPDPISTKRFSGKFVVRVPPDVHRGLAIQATEAGVSLNRFVCAKLASCNTAIV